MARGLTGTDGLLTGLVRQVLQTGLEVEMAEHLGYERHAPEGRQTLNSRNGSSPKRVTTEIGEVGSAGSVRPGRDVRAGDGAEASAPPRWPVGQCGLAVCQRGFTTGEIQAHLEEIYDTSVSRETITGDHRRDRRGHSGVAEPAAGRGVSVAVDRRDSGQGPRLVGRQPARLCRHRRRSPRRT